MVQLEMDGKVYDLATTLRVVYSLKDITKAKSLQESVNSISKLDLDGQIDLIYAAYKAGGGKNDVTITRTNFMDMILDTQGILAISNIVNKLADGLLYSGLSQEEAAAKKMEVEKQVQQAGAASSAKGSV